MYHVILETDASDDSSAGVRSRMGLLTAALARVIKDADDFLMRDADYEVGRIELDVLTTRMRGIVEGAVTVRVEHQPDKVSLSLRPA